MNGLNETITVEEQNNKYEVNKLRTTIGIRATTKERLTENKAPGQCYDGFIWQLIDLWERTNCDYGK